MEIIEKIVQPENQGVRIDKWVAQLQNDWSRTQIQNWIKKGLISVNGKQVKANYKCEEGDRITICVPEPVELDVVPEKMDLDIFYEDKDVIIINKPRGMVVHPAPGHTKGTLVNGLLYHCDDLSGINGVLRPGIVHRIDKDTSGLLMVAKNDYAHEQLARQLANKTITRKYVGIVHGTIEESYGTIDAPIGRDKKDRQKMAVVDDGKQAITHFQVLERFQAYTFVEFQLETGRTHQIRVHMKYIGHPLAGDPKYGPKKTLPIVGQALHAKILGFKHPRTGEDLQFESPLPADLVNLLTMLKREEIG
ncbi:RluA family pseudouridine synthase [Fervidibacillus halotolerans]|uniref:Pseudouridine synthase n=1 Tax=Fervidibacillus halotolerans TaxID=2980027 RepID=A0A9E8M2J6_9BACI|nr:RluA family pseudouridine synthase [Fervidibacillus halotolerans]WAA13910.1 RluA family pseudouridine synthase [Fervidibacillus halotolerans]